MPDGAWVYAGALLKRRGRPDRAAIEAAGTFVLGQTPPVPGVNVGVIPGSTLIPYTGPNADRLLTITAPVTYQNIDFGTTQIDVRSSHVWFINCKFTWRKAQDLTYANISTLSTTQANAAPGSVVHMRNGTTFVDRGFRRCTFVNESQWAPIIVPSIGYNFIAERCSIKGFGDCFQAIAPTNGGAVGVELLGNWMGELSWWDAPTGGIVHPTTRYQHCDCFQWQGGTGVRLIGNWADAHYSTTIGTGTPNSGKDTGGLRAEYNPYTQAEGVARRLAVVDEGVVNQTGPTAHLGGSISGFMFSTSPRGYVVDGEVRNNWGSGGSAWLNAGDAQLTGNFGIVSGNRVAQNQRLAGWAMNISLGLGLDYHDNIYIESGQPIPAKRV